MPHALGCSTPGLEQRILQKGPRFSVGRCWLTGGRAGELAGRQAGRVGTPVSKSGARGIGLSTRRGYFNPANITYERTEQPTEKTAFVVRFESRPTVAASWKSKRATSNFNPIFIQNHFPSSLISFWEMEPL